MGTSRNGGGRGRSRRSEVGSFYDGMICLIGAVRGSAGDGWPDPDRWRRLPWVGFPTCSLRKSPGWVDGDFRDPRSENPYVIIRNCRGWTDRAIEGFGIPPSRQRQRRREGGAHSF